MGVAPLLGGLDIGTTSVKAVLMTPEGDEVAHGRAPTRWTRTRDGVEADPHAVVDAAIAAVADALSRTSGATVSALGVASMAESGVVVAADDSPLAPVIAWHDNRDTAQLADLEQQLGGSRFALRTGLPLWTQWSLTKQRWLHENLPQTHAAVRRYNIAEWVVRRLGGAPVSELSLASRTGWLDLRTAAPWDESLEWARAPSGYLGDLVTAGTPVGRVAADHPHAALRGAVLTIAGHDHQAAVIGSGAVGDNDELDSCGTAEALLRTVGPDLSDAAIAALTSAGVTVGWHAIRDRWCLLGGTRGGLILQKVMAHLGRHRDGLAELDRAALFARSGAAVVSLPDGPENPRVEGSGAPGDVWRAATELVTGQARAVSATMSAAAGPHRELVVTGGWSNSTALMSAKAAALGPLWRVGAGEAGARGAALLAGMAVGAYTSYSMMPRSPRTAYAADPA